MSLFRAPRPTLNRLFCSTAIMVCALTLSACGGSDTDEAGVVQTTNQICPMTLAEAPHNMQPDMQPARGMNVSPEALFAEDIQDPMARIKRAEAAIVDLHRDINALQSPALAATTLTPQDQVPPPAPVMAAGTAAPQNLSPIVNEPAPPVAPVVSKATPTPAPAMAPVIDEPVAKSTPIKTTMAAPSGPVISALRIGEHTGKTRLVLDAGSSVKFTTDLDNSEDLLLVELPGMKWTAPKNGTSSSPAIKSWSTQAMDNGTRLVIVLRQDVAITDKSMIAPDANSASYRAVIDLKHEGTIRKAAPKVTPKATAEPVKAEEPKADPAAAPVATTPTPATAEPAKTETAAPQATTTTPATGTASVTPTTTPVAATPTPPETTAPAPVPPPSSSSAPAPSTTTGTTTGTAAPKTTATTPDGHGHDTVQDGELLSGGQ